MAVEDHEPPGPVAVQALKHLEAELVEDLRVHVDGAGIGGQAGAHAVGDGGCDENIAPLLNPLQQVVGDHGVRAHRHVAAVALDAADGDEHRVVLLKVGLDLGPCEMFQSHNMTLLFFILPGTALNCQNGLGS